jgi:hypothetical protein
MEWLAQFNVVYSLPHMVEATRFGTLYFFAAFTVLAFVFAYLFVSETKAVALEDMNMLFGPNVSVYVRSAGATVRNRGLRRILLSLVGRRTGLFMLRRHKMFYY